MGVAKALRSEASVRLKTLAVDLGRRTSGSRDFSREPNQTAGVPHRRLSALQSSKWNELTRRLKAHR